MGFRSGYFEINGIFMVEMENKYDKRLILFLEFYKGSMFLYYLHLLISIIFLVRFNLFYKGHLRGSWLLSLVTKY